MRVTDGILTNQFLYNFNNSLAKVSSLQEQLSSGKAINRPSDAPVKAVRSLKFKTDLTVNDSFTQNASDAVSWMSTTDGQMSSAEAVIQKIQTLIQSVSVPDPTIAYSSAAQALDGYINELVGVGNMQVGGRYLFAGQKDQNQPFSRDPVTGVVSYSGTWDGQVTVPPNANAGTVTMKVSPGAPDPLRDKINVDGQALYGAIDTTTVPVTNEPQLFSDLRGILAALKAPGVDSTTLTAANVLPALNNTAGPSRSILQALSDDEDHLLTSQTALGARQSVYQDISTRLKSDYVTIKGDLSTNQDLDVSKASIDFQTAQNVYNAALSVGARILPQSLVDYLK